MQAIGEWGVTWSFTDPRPEELDPDLLIVWMARHVDREQLPADRTVVQFDFRDPAKRYWMVLEPSEVSVCLQHPGFDVDLEVTVDTATLYRVYLGRAELAGALRARKLTCAARTRFSAGSDAGSPGARSHPPAGGPTSAAGQRHDSRAPRGCGSNSRWQRILAPEHGRGERRLRRPNEILRSDVRAGNVSCRLLLRSPRRASRFSPRDSSLERPAEVPLGGSRWIRCIGTTCARDRRKLAQRRCRRETNAIAAIGGAAIASRAKPQRSRATADDRVQAKALARQVQTSRCSFLHGMQKLSPKCVGHTEASCPRAMSGVRAVRGLCRG